MIARVFRDAAASFDSLFMVFTATLSTESSWVSKPSITEPNSPAHKQAFIWSDPESRQYRSPQQLCNAHLPRVFFPALAYVCPPSRPVTFVWAHRWSPESLLRKERATSDISISFQSLFNIYQKNNKGLFFRENIVFDIDIVMFSLCIATQSPSDTRSHVHTINQSELKVICVGTQYTVSSHFTSSVCKWFTRTLSYIMCKVLRMCKSKHF